MMDLKQEIQNLPCFSVALTAEDLDATAARDFLRAVFPTDELGFTTRPAHGGHALFATFTHDGSFVPDDCLGPFKEGARERGWNSAVFRGRSGPPPIRLMLMDMDSTAINEEVIEELADFAGVRQQVAEVTRLAMEGKLDFHQALRDRVATLKGQPASVMRDVLEKHITPTPGLEAFVAGLHARGVFTAIVSGGFISIVQPFADKHGIQFARANQLAVDGAVLTGEVEGEIVDATVKERTLMELCQRVGCKPEEAMCVGDGANDLKMINASGLGIAFCAKRIVQQQAPAAINRRRLDDALWFLEEES